MAGSAKCPRESLYSAHSQQAHTVQVQSASQHGHGPFCSAAIFVATPSEQAIAKAISVFILILWFKFKIELESQN